MLGLTNDLHGEEWIYWCIDDKYPIVFDLPGVKDVLSFVEGMKTTDISGILFCRCRHMRGSRNLTRAKITDHQGNIYLERKSYHQIWIHQFLRVKVLQYLFESFPDTIPSPKCMDEYKLHITKPVSHRLFVSKLSFAVFGESTTRGKLTPNCHDSIVDNNLELPNWFLTTEDDPWGNIMGSIGNTRIRCFLDKWVRGNAD
jgi:hypothetical protein